MSRRMTANAIAKSFSVFSLIGGVFYLLAVGLNGLTIDVFGLHAFWSSFCVMLTLFMAKYLIYVWLGTILPRFWRYALANAAVTLLATISIALLVEHMAMAGWLASAFAIGFFMVLRYAVLYRVGVINRV